MRPAPRTSNAIASAASLALSAGCAIEATGVCTQAASHVAACSGRSTALAASPGRCIGEAKEMAQQALDTSCSNLRGPAGKAD